jgi:hypothetical protein
MSEEDAKKSIQQMMNKSVAWLLSQETKEGWEGDIRTTCYAIQALIASGFSPLENPVLFACDFLCAKQDPHGGTWGQNDGDTAEVLRTLVICGKSKQDKIISDGLKGLHSLKTSKKFIVRSDVGWVHPILVARAFIALGEDATELLDAIALFLTGDVGYDVKYTSRAVLAYKEAKREDNSLLKAEDFLKKSVNNVSSLSGEYIGYLLQALVSLGHTLETGTIKRILDYLEKIQKDNGSWEDNIKATAQIIIGLATLGLRYKKPSLLSMKNITRILILATLVIVAIILALSNIQPFVTLIINIVEIFVGLIVILEWAFPKIRLRV